MSNIIRRVVVSNDLTSIKSDLVEMCGFFSMEKVVRDFGRPAIFSEDISEEKVPQLTEKLLSTLFSQAKKYERMMRAGLREAEKRKKELITLASTVNVTLEKQKKKKKKKK